MEVVINGDALLNALSTKASELPDRLEGLGFDVSDILVRNSQKESPHDFGTSISRQKNPKLTGNLAASIKPNDNGPLSYIIAPDEGVAPYALFVILEGVITRLSW